MSAVADPVPVLVTAALAFSFGQTAVLRGASLQIAGGELVALIGPNGAGKSTLIRCISGRLRPTAGSIRIAGHDPHRHAAARSALGLVPQAIALYPHLSVAENIAVFARLAGRWQGPLARRVASTIGRCELGAVAEQRAAALSGGWQRRVNIACALAHRPRLLILDEPTVGIDPPARRHIEALIKGLANDGLAVLMTSHDLDQLERLADRVAFLDQGRLVADDAPMRMLQRHFGGRREVALRLEMPASAAAVAALEKLGLTPIDDLREDWQGLLESETAARLPAGLPGDICVAELRVRRPGLDSMWRHLYGEWARGVAE